MLHRARSLILDVSVGCLLFTLWTSPLAWADEVRRFDNDRIVRVDVNTKAEYIALEATEAEILNCIPGIGPMDVLVAPKQLQEIRELGLAVRVLHEDVQALVDAQFAAPRRADPFEDFFLDYHEYGDAFEPGTIVWYMNKLVELYPALASMVEVGSTLEGRTIWAIRITNDVIMDNKPAVVYFGCEHAREWIASTVPTYVATHLLENYATDETVTDLVDNVEFFLIPVFNVDGYVYSWTSNRMWRKNRRDNGNGTYGVDINRNWGEGWGCEGASINPGNETYRGTAPFSEPENQVLRDFFISHANVRAQLDIHSYAQHILWPWAYKPTLPPDQDVYEDLGLTMQSLIHAVHGLWYTAGSAYTTFYPFSGGSIDWTYADRDILSYTYELRPTEYPPGFLLPPDQIIPNNEEVLPAILLLSNSDWVRSAPPIRFHFPDGLRERIAAGEDTTVAVNVIPVLEGVVPGSGRLYYRYDFSGPFIDLPLTSLGGEAYEVVLPAADCSSIPEFYFSAQADGGSEVTSPDNAPDEVYTASVSSPGFFKEDLDTDPGWTTEEEWAFGQPTGGGGEYGWHDPTSGYTGDNVYGYDLNGDYDARIPEYHLTSPPIDCTGRFGVHLVFRRWLGVERPLYDHAYVRVSNNGTDWVTIWENPIQVADTSWTYQNLDISAVADNQPTVQLRWTMGRTDFASQYCGWNIDDIELYSTVCGDVAGDYNGDGDVDLEDYAQFELCFSGPGGAPGPGCSVFDLHADEDVDCDDWVEFLAAWNGPSEPP